MAKNESRAMTIKLVLPAAAPHTTTYTEAKAEGALLMIDALQKKYSPNYYRPDSLYANWPHNIDAYINAHIKQHNCTDEKFGAELIAAAMCKGQPELTERYADIFPKSRVSFPGSPFVFLHQFDAAVIDVAFRKKILIPKAEQHLRDDINKNYPGFNIDTGQHPKIADLGYVTEWREKLGFYPHRYLWSFKPDGVSADVFTMVNRALLAEDGADQCAAPAAYAALFFKTPQDFLLYYADVNRDTRDGANYTIGVAMYSLVQRFLKWRNPSETRIWENIVLVFETTPEERRAFMLSLEGKEKPLWLPKATP